MTPEQIEAKAREIGNRPYHPIPPRFYAEGSSDFAIPGITIRQELMRTAMGALIPIKFNVFDEDYMATKTSRFTNALLLEMAKQELEE